MDIACRKLGVPGSNMHVLLVLLIFGAGYVCYGCREVLQTKFVTVMSDVTFHFHFDVSSITGFFDAYDVLLNNTTKILSIRFENGNLVIDDSFPDMTIIGNLTVGNISFAISRFNYSKAGWYSFGKLGMTILQCQMVFVLGEPSVALVKEGTDPLVGGMVVFRCSATSHTEPVGNSFGMIYEWRFNSENASGARFNFSGDTMTISNITKADYKKIVSCKATENVTGGLTSVESNGIPISVVYGPDSVWFQPTATNHTIMPSTSINITCEADCNSCNYKWTRNEVLMRSQATLYFRSIEFKDAGTYRCTASRGDNTAEKELTLNVIYGPCDIHTLPTKSHYREDELTVLKPVRCNSSCWPCEYTWSGPQNFSSGAQLTLPPLQKNLHGIYMCTALNTYTNMTAVTNISLEVRYGPDSVSIEPRQTNYIINEGDDLSDITCIAQCFPACLFTWVKNVKTAVSNSSVLHFGKNISRNLNGTYSCIVKNKDNETWVEVVKTTLNVRWQPSSPIIIPVSKPFPWLEGQKGILKCSAEDMGNPAAAVSWSTSVGYVDLRDQLVIETLSYLDNQKDVKCQLQNAFTSSQDTIVELSIALDVEYVPQLNISSDGKIVNSITIVEGKDREVVCSATGNPQPEIEWSGSTYMLSGGNLIFNDTKRSETGTYICQATASSSADPPYQLSANKSLNVVVHYPPDVTIDLFGDGIEGQTLQIICKPDGLPKEYNFHKWTQKLAQTLITGNDFLQPNSRITIPSLKLQDSGNYSCSVDNTIVDKRNMLKQVSVIEILVKVRPTFFMQEALFAGQLAGNITVSISFYAYPIFEELAVKHNGIVVSNTSKHIINTEETVINTRFYDSNVDLKGHRVLFTIINLEEKDFALYHLHVSNAINSTQMAFSVISESIPQAPTDFQLVEVDGNTAWFVWRKGFNGGQKQTFVLQLSHKGQNSWSNETFVDEDDKYSNIEKSFRANITDLKPGSYDVKLVAFNAIGSAAPLLLGTTLEITSSAGAEAVSFPIGVAVGGGLGTGCIIILVVVLTIVWKRRSRTKKDDFKRSILSPKRHPASEQNDTAEVNVNPMYESADEIQLPPTSDIYAQVHKQPKSSAQDSSADVYSQVQKPKVEISSRKEKKMKKQKDQKKPKNTKQTKLNEGLVYENAEIPNSGKKTSEYVYVNPTCSDGDEKKQPKRTRNEDGLIYIDVELPKQTASNKQKPEIHGEEDRTIYADIAYGKVGEQPPEKDGESQ